MSGKYYIFTLPDGTTLKGKRRLCVAYNMTEFNINKLLSDGKGHFTINSQKIKYQLVRQLMEPRSYIPNPKGRGKSQNKTKPTQPGPTITKRFGNTECEYCSKTGRLIRSRAVII
jgi:hypothetical protein